MFSAGVALKVLRWDFGACGGERLVRLRGAEELATGDKMPISPQGSGIIYRVKGRFKKGVKVLRRNKGLKLVNAGLLKRPGGFSGWKQNSISP